MKRLLMSVVVSLVVIVLYVTALDAQTSSITLVWPVTNGQNNVSQYFTPIDPNTGIGHTAMDILSSGDDNIYATQDGIVVHASWTVSLYGCTIRDPAGDIHATNSESEWDHPPEGWSQGYFCGGYYVKVHHDSVGGGTYYTSYHHLLEGSLLVSVGDRVSKGQHIATMGTSGQSTGKHLHFVLNTDANSVLKGATDPLPFLSGSIPTPIPTNVPVPTETPVPTSTSTPDATANDHDPPTGGIVDAPAVANHTLTIKATASDASGIRQVQLKIWPTGGGQFKTDRMIDEKIIAQYMINLP